MAFSQRENQIPAVACGVDQSRVAQTIEVVSEPGLWPQRFKRAAAKGFLCKLQHNPTPCGITQGVKDDCMTYSIFNRRQLLFSLAATAAVGSLPADANVVRPTEVLATDLRRADPFQVRSSDGVVLSGDAQGDPAAPAILSIHGLRQSRLSWDKQFSDPALAGFRDRPL